MYDHCRQASYVFGDMAACDLRGSLTAVPINFMECHLKRNGQANQPPTGIAVSSRDGDSAVGEENGANEVLYSLKRTRGIPPDRRR
jgi:hypothetical protein